jgi:AcrR family transcriptional regulator
MPSRTPTNRLTAETIVRVALRLARTEGLDSISMRRLADELQVSAMALYRHVVDREDLLIRMLGEIADDIQPPPSKGTPRQRIVTLMEGLHTTFRDDPWAVQVLATEGLASPRILPVIDALFGALADAGLDPERSRAGLALLLQFTFGEALMTHHDRADTYGRRMLREADPNEFPHIHHVVENTQFTPQDFFAVNLQHLLDGILNAT